jgi:murein DD-endopeptidase MepM/ murein hydrolase activator NlpD
VYAIRRGDTLLAIAGMYGVSVTALQETNGIVDPRALRIDQQIIIPHDEEALLGGGEPTATPTPLPFAIENIHFDRTPMGGLWCLGEIHNTTTEYLDHVQVRVTLHDENREPLVTESAFVQLDLIAPDGRSPFALYFAEAPISFASYEAQPLSGVPAYLGSYYRDLEVRGVEAQADRYASYAVRGIVANVGPEDALGEVIGVREGIPEHNVVPRGGETTFQVELVPAGGPVVTYTIQALGQRILPTPSTSP